MLSRLTKPPYGSRPAPRFWLYVLIYLLSLFAAAHCEGGVCVGQLSLWTPAENSNQTHQWIQPAARGEAACSLTKSLKVFGRGDFYAIPGQSALDIATVRVDTVGAIEAWGGLSLHVAGPLSVAGFGGVHSPVSNGAIVGGTSASWCGGIRADSATTYFIGGVCSAYGPLGPGTAVVATNVISVKGPVGIAWNVAYIPATGKRLFAAGPTVSWH